MKNFPVTLLAVNLLITCILLSVLIITDSQAYFLQKFSENDIYRYFPGDKAEIEQQFVSVQSYILLKSSYLDSSFFTGDDIIHLQDIRKIYSVIYIIFAGSLVFAAGTAIEFRGQILTEITKKSVIIAFLLLIFLVAVVNNNFNGFFIFFHQVMFPGGYWQLDPASSSLVRYFMNNIFQETFLLFCFSTAILISCSHIFSIIYWKITLIWKRPKLKKS